MGCLPYQESQENVEFRGTIIESMSYGIFAFYLGYCNTGKCCWCYWKKGACRLIYYILVYGTSKIMLLYLLLFNWLRLSRKTERNIYLVDMYHLKIVVWFCRKMLYLLPDRNGWTLFVKNLQNLSFWHCQTVKYRKIAGSVWLSFSRNSLSQLQMQDNPELKCVTVQCQHLVYKTN